MQFKFPVKLFLLLSLLLLNFKIIGQKSVIKEEARSILTYPYSDPNPVPAMAVSSMASPFYPYFVFDGYTDKGLNKDWKVISLDNDFINVTLLPEAGGKVWGAIEKSTGREFVYQNHVMKFRAIGIRGPWTSGGIEHNFGLDLGHAPWTASPVDYLIKNNDDGSVSCIVGGFDPASRTQWRISVVLPADKAYFETRGMWYNPTPLHDAYLSWENAGFRASDDLQFYFPGNYYIGHDGSVNPWPADKEGRDLSLYRNNNFGTSKSYHVSGAFTGWFGGYWHDADFGFGHSASYSDAPGKKIWIWSLARDGAIWEDLLTDTDGQYIEAQSGVKFNQANAESGYHSPFSQLSMRPFYTETKTDYWFPVVKTRGIKDASPLGTLNVIASGDSLEIFISPNSGISDSLTVMTDGNHFFATYLNLKPLSLYHKTIPLSHGEYKNVVVKVGNNLLYYNSDPESLNTDRPVRSSPDTDYNSAEQLFRLAENMSAMRDYSQALKYYLECLDKEPSHSRALYRVAEQYYRQAEYSRAADIAEKILGNDTYDGAGNFIYGVILRRMGNLNQAEEAFSVAARTMEFRSAAYLEIAGIRIRQNDFRNGVIYSEKALDYNHYNIGAYELLASCYRKLNKAGEATRVLDLLLDIDPLDHYARFEKYLLDPSTENLGRFTSMIRNELPRETYMELAMQYINQGLNDEAVQVLELSPAYPVAYYWLAYLYRDSSKEKSDLWLRKATEMSPYLVFPYRQETIPVLEWAIASDQSWKSKYYLGLIYWHILRTTDAAALFEQCGDNPDFAPFYIARGSLFQNIPSNYCYPCSDFSEAVKLDPGEWRTWHYLTNFLQASGSFQLQLENSRKAFERFPANPVIGTDYAKALLNSGRYRECISILGKVNILPQEGAHEGHDIFELANLSIAVDLLEKGRYSEALRFVNISRNWPENLGAGKPYGPDNRLQDYISAYCYARLGNQKLSDSYSDLIINYLPENEGLYQDPSNLLLSNLVLNDRGRQSEASRNIEIWKTKQDSLFNWHISSGSSSGKAQWLLARFGGEEEKAAAIEKEISSVPSENRFRLFLRTLNDINKIRK